MADALKFYREECDDESIRSQFQGSEATEEYIRMVDAFFDIANTRTPESGITKANWAEKKEVSCISFNSYGTWIYSDGYFFLFDLRNCSEFSKFVTTHKLSITG